MPFWLGGRQAHTHTQERKTEIYSASMVSLPCTPVHAPQSHYRVSLPGTVSIKQAGGSPHAGLRNIHGLGWNPTHPDGHPRGVTIVGNPAGISFLWGYAHYTRYLCPDTQPPIIIIIIIMTTIAQVHRSTVSHRYTYTYIPRRLLLYTTGSHYTRLLSDSWPSLWRGGRSGETGTMCRTMTKTAPCNGHMLLQLEILVS